MSVEGPWWRKYVNDWRTIKSASWRNAGSFKQISAENEKKLQELRVSVLGKKGSLTEILKGMKDISAEIRPVIGKHVNEARDVLTAAFEETTKLWKKRKSKRN